MSSNTKIVVLRSKELIYALVLLIVVVLIIIVALSLFMPEKSNTVSLNDNTYNESSQNNPQKKDTYEEETNPTPDETSSTEYSGSAINTAETESSDLYVPGIYSGIMQLGSTNIELQITLDKNHINSITFTNIDESVATMYPLMEPTLNDLSTRIISEQSIENINYADENRYTSMLLMQAISETIEKAKVSENADSPDNTGTIMK